MSDEQLATAMLGALAVLLGLMLEASDRLQEEPDHYREVTRVQPDVVVLEQPEESHA